MGQVAIAHDQINMKRTPTQNTLAPSRTRSSPLSRVLLQRTRTTADWQPSAADGRSRRGATRSVCECDTDRGWLRHISTSISTSDRRSRRSTALLPGARLPVRLPADREIPLRRADLTPAHVATHRQRDLCVCVRTRGSVPAAVGGRGAPRPSRAQSSCRSNSNTPCASRRLYQPHNMPFVLRPRSSAG